MIPTSLWQPHNKLPVWQKATALGRQAYRLANKLPASERYELGSQLRTAGSRIMANIAEGKGRRTKGEFAQFLGIARGSTREVHAHLELAVDVGLLTLDDVHQTLCLTIELSKLLTAMMRKLAPF